MRPEYGPDADATPLSARERELFNTLAAQISTRRQRWGSRLFLGRPAVLGVMSAALCAVLVVLCALVAPFSLLAAVGCWVLMVMICVANLPRWAAMLSGYRAKLRSLLRRWW